MTSVLVISSRSALILLRPVLLRAGQRRRCTSGGDVFLSEHSGCDVA
jgi:hypothetical protein